MKMQAIKHVVRLAQTGAGVASPHVPDPLLGLQGNGIPTQGRTSFVKINATKPADKVEKRRISNSSKSESHPILRSCLPVPATGVHWLGEFAVVTEHHDFSCTSLSWHEHKNQAPVFFGMLLPAPHCLHCHPACRVVPSAKAAEGGVGRDPGTAAHHATTECGRPVPVGGYEHPPVHPDTFLMSRPPISAVPSSSLQDAWVRHACT